MSKAAEDIVFMYDGSVRNQSTQKIVDFCYGSDNMDASKLYPVKLVFDENPDLDPLARKLARVCVLQMRSANNLRVSGICMLPFNFNDVLKHFVSTTTIVHPNTDTSLLKAEVNRKTMELYSLLKHSESKRANHSTLFLRFHILSESRPEKVANALPNLNAIGELFKDLTDRYFQALLDPGEAVGLLAAESIGEPLTQLCLNVFHTAGVGSAVSHQGIPRINELLDCNSKIKSPSMLLFAKDRNACLEDISTNLPFRILESSVDNVYVFNQPSMFDTGLVHDTDQDWGAHISFPQGFLEEQQMVIHTTCLLKEELEPAFKEDGLSPFVIVILINGSGGLAAEEVARSVCDFVGNEKLVFVETSSRNMRNRFVRIRIAGCESLLKKEQEKRPSMEKESLRLAMFRHLTYALSKELLYKVSTGSSRKVSNAQAICVSDARCSYTGEKRIITHGSDLVSSWKIEELDWRRSLTNDVMEVERVLGVEAATAVLYNEMTEVLEAGSATVSPRHIILLVSIMTCAGKVKPLTRYGVDRTGTPSTISKITYEMQGTHLMEAALFHKEHMVRGLSDSLVAGSKPHIGTGIVRLLVKDEKAREPSEEKEGLSGTIVSCLETDTIDVKKKRTDLLSLHQDFLPDPRSLLKKFRTGAPTKNSRTDSVVRAEEIAEMINGTTNEDTIDLNEAQAAMLANFVPSSPMIAIQSTSQDPVGHTSLLCDLPHTAESALYTKDGELLLEEFEKMINLLL